jgi:hypothetical protein
MTSRRRIVIAFVRSQRGRLSLAAFLAAFASGGVTALADSAPPQNFGTPPSGQVPILYNDQHVYARPDKIKANRALAALVRGGTILVPLRSMFEQMGATVTWDPASQTADVSKTGADVKITVGRPEVVINGETRPLDVPPEIYHGVVVVPIRVISEGMGAYVQWVPDKRVVVVRYIPAPPATLPPPPPPPPPPPILKPPPPPPPPPPRPTPTPAPIVRNPYEHFIVGDYIFAPKVYNELSPGNSGKGISYAVRGAAEFPLFGLPWMLEGDYRSYSYPHNSEINPALFAGGVNPCPHPGVGPFPAAGDPGCVTVIGAYGQTAVPSFTARDSDFDARFGLRIAQPRIYIGVGYLVRELQGISSLVSPSDATNFTLSGIGAGIEKLPDLENTVSVYGSVWYYPTISGNFTFPAGAPPALVGTTDKFQQRFLKYQIGGTLNLGNSGLFLDAGFLGDTIRGQSLSPSDASHNGGYVGLGIKF